METSQQDTPTDAVAKAALTNALKIFVSTIHSLHGFGQPKGINETVNTLNQMIKEANASVR